MEENTTQADRAFALHAYNHILALIDFVGSNKTRVKSMLKHFDQEVSKEKVQLMQNDMKTLFAFVETIVTELKVSDEVSDGKE